MKESYVEAGETRHFLLALSLGEASLMELESLEELGTYGFKILDSDRVAALIHCTEQNAKRLIKRTGGSFKISRVLGRDILSSLESMALPFDPKFNWTVSGYSCDHDQIHEARAEIHDLLKSKGLGKSKLIEPEIMIEDTRQGTIAVAEIKSSELSSRILEPESEREGIDFVVHGGFGGKPVYAQTFETSDFRGYDERDFMRPYQDPTKTISPRIARILVNLATTSEHLTLLDPFCGLGTILQEALVCGHSVVGVDRQEKNVDQSRENLRWTRTKYGIRRGDINLFAYDARRISRARMRMIDAIASEPILLPIFTTNPAPAQARLQIQKVAENYQRCMGEFASVLRGKKRRIAITSPVLVDSSGMRRTFSLEEAAISAGFRAYHGRLSGRRVTYPLELESSKKRIVQRAMNVYCVA